ncbi:MAG: chemotaxis protein CheX, partial [Magnetococcales bacterium]|nr:chemotaxis protein CheX [Magnetococcales bacterium]
MQDKFLQAIRDAIQEIAETMLFVEIIPGESEHARCSLGADVSAVIGYSSSLKGSMRLAGPQKTVLKLAAALLGEERDVLDKEMEDAFSELANMIAGGVQTRVEGELGMIRMSPPVVISGKNHQVSSDR